VLRRTGASHGRGAPYVFAARLIAPVGRRGGRDPVDPSRRRLRILAPVRRPDPLVFRNGRVARRGERAAAHLVAGGGVLFRILRLARYKHYHLKTTGSKAPSATCRSAHGRAGDARARATKWKTRTVYPLVNNRGRNKQALLWRFKFHLHISNGRHFFLYSLLDFVD
jgi:hypothetical protein